MSQNGELDQHQKRAKIGHMEVQNVKIDHENSQQNEHLDRKMAVQNRLLDDRNGHLDEQNMQQLELHMHTIFRNLEAMHQLQNPTFKVAFHQI